MAIGHRKRLRDLVEKVGLYNLSIYQQMEYILYFVLPRVNTTEVAHELIDTFGNIHSVLEAPPSELQNIKGLGPDSAFQLSHLIQILDLYKSSKNNSNKNLSTLAKTAVYFYDMLCMKKEECFMVATLNSKDDLISCKRLSIGKEDYVSLNTTEMIRYISSTGAKSIVLCHNHPNDICYPSKDDVNNTDNLRRLLSTIGIKLFDHLIIGNDGVYSITKSGKLAFPLEDGVIVYE